MHRHLRRLQACAAGLLVALCCALLVGPAAASAAGEIPGVLLPPSPVQGSLTSADGVRAVYNVEARFWDRLSFTLTGDSSLFGSPAGPVGIALYGPDAVSVTSSVPIASASGLTFPVQLVYVHLPLTGAYFIAVFAERSEASGAYSLAWSCKSPVMVYAAPHSTTICRGGSARVSGLVKYAADSTPIAGHEVVLLRSATGGDWVQILSTETGAGGGYSFMVRPQRTRYYRVVSTGTGTLLRGFSSPRVKVVVRR
jgi:hypothetical protein